MKKLFIAIPLALAAGYFAASPYLSAYQLQQAVDSADGDKVVAMMDIESVKRHLTHDLHDLIKDSFGSDEKTLNIKEDIAKRYITMTVDTFMTPQGVRQIIESQAQRKKGENNESQDVSLSYLSPNRFLIQVTSEKGIPINLEMHRHFLGWKISNIHIPKSYLKSII